MTGVRERVSVLHVCNQISCSSWDGSSEQCQCLCALRLELCPSDVKSYPVDTYIDPGKGLRDFDKFEISKSWPPTEKQWRQHCYYCLCHKEWKGGWRDGSALKRINLSLLPNTHVLWLTATSASSSKESNATFWILWAPPLTWAQICMYTVN